MRKRLRLSIWTLRWVVAPAAVALAGLALAGAAGMDAPRPVVRVDGGLLQGVAEDGSRSWWPRW